jgi:hypothetical protein
MFRVDKSGRKMLFIDENDDQGMTKVETFLDEEIKKANLSIKTVEAHKYVPIIQKEIE